MRCYGMYGMLWNPMHIQNSDDYLKFKQLQSLGEKRKKTTDKFLLFIITGS